MGESVIVIRKEGVERGTDAVDARLADTAGGVGGA